MRVAVYKDNLSTGRGADRAVRNFAAGLAERGHDVALFERGELAERLSGHWDVVVATGSNEIADLDRAGYFSRDGRSPVVLQLHLAPRGFFKWKHPLRNRAIRRAFDKADAVQVLCRSYEAEFARIAPHPRTATIGNYTEMPEPPDAPDGARTSRTILYPAAAFTKVKNQELLIRAFARLAGDFPGWRVRLLGRNDTRYAVRCRRLVRRLRLEGRVDFAGFTRDLPGEYSGAAFVAFPSTLEGFPLALLEAARYGLCAVGLKTLPGAEDIIDDGATGMLSEPTVGGYAECLRRAMADESLRVKLGESAKARYAAEFERGRILDAWERLLSEAAQAGAGRGGATA